MIVSLVNLLFGCEHKRLSFPITPINRDVLPHRSQTYLACLDCGKEFISDDRELRIGKKKSKISLPKSAGNAVWRPNS